MRSAAPITGYLNNIQHYTEEIIKEVNAQIELDWKDAEARNKLGEFCSPTATRFVCLCCMKEASEWIQLYLKNIAANMQTAVNQNRILRGE